MSETISQQEAKPQQSKIPGSVDNLDKIPEPLRPFYVPDEKSGKFVAQVDGHYVPATRLAEFRETNTEVMKRLTAAETDLAVYRALGEDPKALEAEVKEGRRLKQLKDDNELVDKKGWETALSQRTDQMKQTYEGQINALKEQVALHKETADKVTAENKRIVVSGELTKAGIGAGILASAIPDLLARAERDGWTRTEKGELALIDPKTNTYVYGANGVDYITPEEYVLSLKQTARHYFNIPFGGGASGSDNSFAGKNPWSKDGWNDTAQAKVYREDPIKAEQLAKAAGSYLGALPPR